MLKKTLLVAMVAALVMGLSGIAFAADGEKFTGKIVKIDGVRVTVAAEGGLPAWVKAGTRVSASGGAPVVLRIKDKEMTLKFGKAKAEQLKVDQVLEITPSSGDVPQGC
ncbi:MAG: hypothetical protein IH611_01660 [Deltaproteobacteria bacterium]|nr:hypothetical protein [Deltaproteobacteria bacterium]